MPAVLNTQRENWKEEETPRGEMWKYIDLSGKRIGARIEELEPGDTSSVHHYHTAEEEHVLVLEGDATLIMDSERIGLNSGDHVWFESGRQEAHHIENTSDKPFTFLVFGERNSRDVVVYPQKQVMLVKSLGYKQFTYRAVAEDDLN